MKMRRLITFAVFAALCLAPLAQAQVNYEEDRLTLNNVVLLRDYKNPSQFYYIPPVPRISINNNGDFEFVCLKFVDPDGENSGGLLHFLVEFDLPEEEVQALQAALEAERPGARLMGPVPMFESENDKEEGNNSFQVVSAVLQDSEDPDSLTRRLITSGHAPLLPGSKTAVAAILKQEGATLLWDTLDGPVSDISITINASYEAVVEGFNGRIHAEVENVYEHMSRVFNKQSGYKKREIRDIVDEMVRDQTINVEVFDRSDTLGIDSSQMQRIIDLCTDKIVELIFNPEIGLAKMPEREQAIEKGQIKRRQERGAFVKFFAGEGNQEYITDNQYVMKNREDISRATFSVNLSSRTTIKVPFSTSGNIGGIYEEHKNNDRMFRIVNLADPSFQKREIHFTVDRDYLKSFEDTINFVTINFRKKHKGRPDTTDELQFTHADVKEGTGVKYLSYPRLGEQSSDWLNYEYRLSWSVFGREPIRVPVRDDNWIEASDAVINLVPPFQKTSIELEADRAEFETNNIQSGVVEVRYKLLGEEKTERIIVMRGTDAEPMNTFTIYHDERSTPELRITWYGKRGLGRQTDNWQPVDTTYMFLSPPMFEEEQTAETADAGGE